MKLPVFFVFLLCSNVLLSSADIGDDDNAPSASVDPAPAPSDASSTDAPDKDIQSLEGTSSDGDGLSVAANTAIEPLVQAILDSGNIPNKYEAAVSFLGRIKDMGYNKVPKFKLAYIKDTVIYLVTKMTTLGDFCILATQMLTIIKKRVNSLLDALLVLITKLCKDFINNELHKVTYKIYGLMKPGA